MKVTVKPPKWMVFNYSGKRLLGTVLASGIDLALDLARQKYGHGIVVGDTWWQGRPSLIIRRPEQ